MLSSLLTLIFIEPFYKFFFILFSILISFRELSRINTCFMVKWNAINRKINQLIIAIFISYYIFMLREYILYSHSTPKVIPSVHSIILKFRLKRSYSFLKLSKCSCIINKVCLLVPVILLLSPPFIFILPHEF